jgi:5-methylcytosine-specific restriction endonuclease McrA
MHRPSDIRYAERRHAAQITSGQHIRVKHLWPHCGICGDLIERREDASIDHLVPISQGGAETPDNVCLTHKRCNHARSNRTGDAA